jgi:hypothetical protein
MLGLSRRVQEMRVAGGDNYDRILRDADRLISEMRLAQEIDGCCFHAAIALVLPAGISVPLVSDEVSLAEAKYNKDNTHVETGSIKGIGRGIDCIEQDPNEVYLELATRQGNICYPMSCISRIQVERRGA